jgi:predicted RNase H-like HicB family nuclease
MTKHYTAIITKEDSWYVARCLDLDVTSQGRTIEEAKANLKEAVDLYIESFGEDTPLIPTDDILMYKFEVNAGA